MDYDGLAQDIAHLMPGDLVTVTDTDLHWDERVAQVGPHTLTDGTACGLSVVIPEVLS